MPESRAKMIFLESLNIEYQYGGYSKFTLRNEIFEKFEYRICVWLIFNIQYQSGGYSYIQM